MKKNASQKAPVTQVPQKPTEGEPAAKQKSPPAPTQQSERLSRAVAVLTLICILDKCLNHGPFGVCLRKR